MIDTNMTVSDLMTTSLILGKVDDTVDVAEMDMKLAGIRHLLIVDNQNSLVGVVSDRDVLRAISAHGTTSLVLGAIMSMSPVMIRDTDPARKALEVMLERKISCLPVEGDEGQVVGVVTETDFMRLLYNELDSEAAA